MGSSLMLVASLAGSIFVGLVAVAVLGVMLRFLLGEGGDHV
ncbi:hypothetical protein [Magnetococcus sp. PR-3]